MSDCTTLIIGKNTFQDSEISNPKILEYFGLAESPYIVFYTEDGKNRCLLNQRNQDPVTGRQMVGSFLEPVINTELDRMVIFCPSGASAQMRNEGQDDS